MSVLVAGSGPAGLMLAGELALAGVPVTVLDRLPQRSPHPRGFTLSTRSLELLDRRGLVDRFLAEGPTVPYAMFADPARPLDLSVLDTDHPYLLGIPQNRVEELLEAWIGELGVTVAWDTEVVDVRQTADGVRATVVTADGKRQVLDAAYLVGCDGSRSTVRRAAGIAFPGTDATSYGLVGDVELADPAALPFGVTAGERGTVFVVPRPGYVRIIVDDPTPPSAGGPADIELPYFQDALDRALGRHTALRAQRWLSRFSDAARQAERYVADRVVLAGDAAHIHPPSGAVGVNVAIADAVNLGWKLAATVQGHAPPGLLATYHDERHAVGAEVLRMTRAQAILGRRDPQIDPLRELFADLGALGDARRRLAELVTGAGTRYDARIPGEHPWLGRLAPNMALTGTDGVRVTVAELLASARPVLLRFAEGAAPPVPRDRVDTYRVRCAEHLGRPAPPDLEGLLLRPDGHIAWLSTTDAPQPHTLADALGTWITQPGDGIGGG